MPPFSVFAFSFIPEGWPGCAAAFGLWVSRNSSRVISIHQILAQLRRPLRYRQRRLKGPFHKEGYSGLYLFDSRHQLIDGIRVDSLWLLAMLERALNFFAFAFLIPGVYSAHEVSSELSSPFRLPAKVASSFATRNPPLWPKAGGGCNSCQSKSACRNSQ